jgi:hypothetical protein
MIMRGNRPESGRIGLTIMGGGRGEGARAGEARFDPFGAPQVVFEAVAPAVVGATGMAAP